jgi:hypothetical protein
MQLRITDKKKVYAHTADPFTEITPVPHTMMLRMYTEMYYSIYTA